MEVTEVNMADTLRLFRCYYPDTGVTFDDWFNSCHEAYAAALSRADGHYVKGIISLMINEKGWRVVLAFELPNTRN